MEANDPAAVLRQLVNDWQAAKQLAAMNQACGDAQQSLHWGQAALSVRWRIVESVNHLAAALGKSAPRSLIEFGVRLQPHGDESKALELWTMVQVDLRTMKPAKQAGEAEAKGKKLTANELMKGVLESNPDAKGWTIREFSSEIKRSPSTISDTEVWKQLELMREQIKAERAKDRRGRNVRRR